MGRRGFVLRGVKQIDRMSLCVFDLIITWLLAIPVSSFMQYAQVQSLGCHDDVFICVTSILFKIALFAGIVLALAILLCSFAT